MSGPEHRRSSRALILPLLAALLSQAADLHLHAPGAPDAAVHAEQHDAHPVGAVLDARCVACRSGSSPRHAIATAPTGLSAGDDPAEACPAGAAPLLLSRLLRATGPPRAPPV